MVQHRRKTRDRHENADGRGPSVSVVIPVLGEPKTLAGAVHSIRTQTYPCEIIVVQDDGTKGMCKVRNEGIEQAKGEIVVLQDSDDYSLPDRVERIVDAIGDADVLVHGLYTNAWNEQYQCMERHYHPPKMPSENLYKEQDVNGVAVFKKAWWVKHPFQERFKYVFDWGMHLDWWLSGAKYVTLDRGLYEYVRYQGSSSDRFEKQGLRAQGYEQIKLFLKEHGRA